MRYLAFHDGLTGLANRAMLLTMGRQAMHAAASAQQRLALVFIDLDGFKAVNDTLGHDAGDRLLITVAKRLRRATRESDTVARLGGDEFAILLTQLQERKDVDRLVRKLLAALEAPFQLSGRRCKIRASVGVAMYPDDAKSVQALLAHADQAMYRAKREGGHRSRFFSD